MFGFDFIVYKFFIQLRANGKGKKKHKKNQAPPFIERSR